MTIESAVTDTSHPIHYHTRWIHLTIQSVGWDRTTDPTTQARLSQPWATVTAAATYHQIQIQQFECDTWIRTSEVQNKAWRCSALLHLQQKGKQQMLHKKMRKMCFDQTLNILTYTFEHNLQFTGISALQSKETDTLNLSIGYHYFLALPDCYLCPASVIFLSLCIVNSNWFASPWETSWNWDFIKLPK